MSVHPSNQPFKTPIPQKEWGWIEVSVLTYPTSNKIDASREFFSPQGTFFPQKAGILWKGGSLVPWSNIEIVCLCWIYWWFIYFEGKSRLDLWLKSIDRSYDQPIITIIIANTSTSHLGVHKLAQFNCNWCINSPRW